MPKRFPTKEVDSLLAPSICQLFDYVENVQFWTKDRKGHYTWVNRGFLLNYSLDRIAQVLGKTDFELSPPHLADQYRIDDERVLRGQTISGRIELVGRFDHTATWSITHKIPTRDSKGKISGTAGITRPLDTASPQLDVQHAALGRVIALIRENAMENWSNQQLARAANLSVRAFERHFLELFRLTPQRYIRRLRVRLASHALVYSKRPLAEIAAAHGFADQSHFTREFRRETGLTPGDYRKQFVML